MRPCTVRNRTDALPLPEEFIAALQDPSVKQVRLAKGFYHVPETLNITHNVRIDAEGAWLKCHWGIPQSGDWGRTLFFVGPNASLELTGTTIFNCYQGVYMDGSHSRLTALRTSFRDTDLGISIGHDNSVVHLESCEFETLTEDAIRIWRDAPNASVSMVGVTFSNIGRTAIATSP